ncbi:helix-turn-helix transcriptional regulator [Bradyrhizobium sp. CCBAU 53380]|uniref:helix-turn-helix transcriptional regulator n=1 Tax=Bradyrhizobium sp. CCBAU 53380 TaxID=1325117 RepID=UPI0023021E4F|nr:helix-turn-helix transcriptional regulator [Bradyrhizobium sp. CCBAU 53380]MDA9420791.1 XRE family transcriptional regulator [Bradyrhizobium sp. CCBAU 53380]
MAKIHHPISVYAADAAVLLGQLLRKARIERKMSTLNVAERAGISRGLLRRIEAGDPRSTIGAVFEVAAIVGVRLFDVEQATMSQAIESNREVMTLLPKSIRARRGEEVKDDF